MNKNAKIILVIILIFTVLSGVSVDLPKNLENLKDLLTDYYYTTAKINISNYSKRDFVFNQLNINAYSLENNEIFTQTAHSFIINLLLQNI